MTSQISSGPRSRPSTCAVPVAGRQCPPSAASLAELVVHDAPDIRVAATNDCLPHPPSRACQQSGAASCMAAPVVSFGH